MPITRDGLKAGWDFVYPVIEDPTIEYAHNETELKLSGGSTAGQIGAAKPFFGAAEAGGDENSQYYYFRRYRPTDMVVNINYSGNINQVREVLGQQLSKSGVTQSYQAYPAMPDTSGETAWIITIDPVLAVIDGGYVTIKGGALNTYLEIRSMKV